MHAVAGSEPIGPEVLRAGGPGPGPGEVAVGGAAAHRDLAGTPLPTSPTG